MLRDKWFRIGAVSALIGGLCCLTPLAVIALGAVGLAGYAIWIDALAVPLLVVGVGIVVASYIRLRQNKA